MTLELITLIKSQGLTLFSNDEVKAQSFAVAMLSLLPRSLHLHILNAPGTLSQGGHKVFLEMWKLLPHSVIVRGSHEKYVFNCVIRYNFRWIGCFIINCRDTRCVFFFASGLSLSSVSLCRIKVCVNHARWGPSAPSLSLPSCATLEQKTRNTPTSSK